MNVERVEQELEDRLAPLTTGGDGGPYPFAPEIADQSFGALCHFAVKDDEANLTFSRIVGWLYFHNSIVVHEREV